MGKNDDAVYAILLFLGAAALADALNPKCPICKNGVELRSPMCKICGSPLRWKP